VLDAASRLWRLAIRLRVGFANLRCFALASLDLTTPEIERLVAAFVTDADHQAARRYQLALRRRQTLAGRALLRRLLENEIGLPRHIYDIAYDCNGRPVVCSRSTSLDIDVSITHSRDRVACAVTGFGAVGIDIEYRAKERAADRIAAASFGPREQHCVAENGIAAFYRFWTLREAMVKALGEDISQFDTHHDCFGPEPPEGAWRSHLGQHAWIFGHQVLADDYSLALALRVNIDARTSFAWDTFCHHWRQVSASHSVS
jgi:phosphopantetheinyl transferase